MVQVTFYGRRSAWAARTTELSDAVHRTLTGEWGIPEAKRFHRFVLLDDTEIVAPSRGPGYLVVQIVCFSGRSHAAVRRLLHAFTDDVVPALGLPVDDLEVVVIESPPSHWGIRGMIGDELALDYRVEI
ncbi:tautomerase family protein [Actinotalea sp. K2]|uniref:tautomerase family protein n=1 Tax=Actinotalea sp. K2 TaxID=2939438 RepID=UPI0020175074|nr:tautomerase family protein [Actinotalea sp. K2]MCL3860681.1 tautomerase family protein [Actinotalea sp. K2]